MSSVEPLAKNPNWKSRRGPVVLVIMDGVGYGKYEEGDALKASKMANLDWLSDNCPKTQLQAHGTAVGLPSDDDMGNSEVGHNAMGCGRIFAQGAKLVSQSIESGALFNGETWLKLINNVTANNTTLHFIGLVSDGNVHSHIDHLKAMINSAHKSGVKKLRVHALLDGRDVDPTSALNYITPLEEFLASFSDSDYKIASGGGRMFMTMDRYNADWSMVERGWKAHVLGEGRKFESATKAINQYRSENPSLLDQDMQEFVICDASGNPCGTINDKDSVIFFNFRGDRSLEITKAFETPASGDFSHFDRKRVPNVLYAGMMEYDGDLHIPKNYLVSPPSIDKTMGEYLTKSGVKLLAISETQKYGHVTYFFNGNRLGKFDEKLEDYIEIKSDVVPFEQRPWMKCAEITDEVIKAIESGKYQHIRLNYPNGDMVGHTGVFNAVVCSMEAMDLQLGRLKEAVKKAGGILCLTADHGNSDDMYEHKKDGSVAKNSDGTPKAKTSHSLNPVPAIIYDPEYQGEYDATSLKSGLGISSWPATLMELMGFVPPTDYDKSLINLK